MPDVSTPGQSPFAPAICQECGAQQQVQARFCWLCGAAQPAPAEPPVVAEIVPARQPTWIAGQNPWVVQASIWGGIVLAFLVGFGVVQAKERALATVYLIAAGPALLLTIIGSAIGRAAGRPWDAGKKILAFSSVFGITLAISVLVVVMLILSAIIAFFELCFGGGR